jgi:hypothetical protein
VPHYFWPYSIRLQAAKLLQPSLGVVPEWSMLGSLVYKEDSLVLQGILKDQSDKFHKFLEVSGRDQIRSQMELIDWFEENKAISSALSRNWEKKAAPPASSTPNSTSFSD